MEIFQLLWVQTVVQKITHHSAIPGTSMHMVDFESL
jgi:hypothetical protein